jgi:hypothetical protein
MVHDERPVGPNALEVVFVDERAVSDAGVVLVATLVDRLGIEALAGLLVRLGERAGAANAGRKIMSLIYAMVLGADCIDDADILRSGSTRKLLGCRVAAPSTLGTFLRAFTFGHVRQLDRLLAETLKRAWAAGAGPGWERLIVDVDSFVGEVRGYEKQGASSDYTAKRGYHPLIATRAASDEVLHVRFRKGAANTQRGMSRFCDELITRVRRAGAPTRRTPAITTSKPRPTISNTATGPPTRDPLSRSVNSGSVHAAACHACQFASETSCERGNRFLDRATLGSTLADMTTATEPVAYFGSFGESTSIVDVNPPRGS